MRHSKLLFVVLAAILLSAGPTLAYTLTEDFTGATFYSVDLTTSAGLNQWNDLVRWQVNPTGGNTGAWAQHTPNATGSNENSLLYYGFDATGLGAGTPYSLTFDYIYQTGTETGAVYVGGLDGPQIIRKNAPWGDLAATQFSQTTITKGSAPSWTAFPTTITGVIPDDYQVLYIAFNMGGTNQLRGIDNVNLQVGAPVPEPATMLLLGSGLVGLAGLRRKFRK